MGAHSVHTRCSTTLRGLCISIALPALLSAQVLPFRHYTTMDGLPSNHITALCQDSRGFLSIGTDEGLSVYDGSAFRTYTTVDGLVSNYVNAIVESRRSPGTMWVSSIAGGVTRLEDGHPAAIRFSGHLPKAFIGAVVEDREGTVWCMTSNGLYRVAGSTLEPAPVYPPEYMDGSDMVLTPAGDVLVGMNRRLYILTPGRDGARIVEPGFRHGTSIIHMSVDREGDVWITTSDSTLRRFTGDRQVAAWRSVSQGLLNEVTLDSDGELWITTSDGLLRMPKRDFPGSRVTAYTQRNGLGEGPLNPALEDREGNLWFGGSGSGLYKLSEKNTVKLPLDHTGVGFTDPAGHFWLQHTGGIWECWKEKDDWITFDHPLHPQGGPALLNIRSDGRGRLWRHYSDTTFECDSIVSQRHGPSQLRHAWSLRPGRDFPGAFVWMFTADARDRLWLSTGRGIAVVELRYPRPEFAGLLRQDDEIRMSSVRAIHRDSKGNVWFGSFSEGLAELVGGDLARREIRHFTVADGLPDNAVRSIAEDGQGRLWIGTRYGGVAVYDGSNFRTLSMQDGLLSNAVWSLEEDGRGRMWLGTGSGAMSISTLDPADFRWSSLIPREPCGVYYASATGTVWIVHAKEVVAVGAESRNVPAPQVSITRVEINDRPVESRGGMEFPPDRNNVVFEFTGPSFRDERSLRYRYRLGGVDTGWSVPSLRQSVSYAALNPGAYTFEVDALTGEGAASASTAVFSFTILAPVWQRWWFVSLAAACIVAGVYFAVRRKVTGLEQRRALQEEFSRRLIDSQESERARIAAELHDSLGQNLLVIKNHALLALDGPPGEREVADRLDDISNATSQAIEEVRQIAHNLRPYHLDKLGLTTSIESIVRRISEASGIAFTSEIEPIDGLFSKEDEIHIFRIVQEALNNILKHSRATKASVTVMGRDRAVSVTIKDNGKGFPNPRAVLPTPADELGGFGLIGLGERIRILQGTISLDSTPGQGTTLLVEIPRSGESHA